MKLSGFLRVRTIPYLLYFYRFPMSDARLAQLVPWVEQQLNQKVRTTPVAGDASFRRYFRCHADSLQTLGSEPSTEEANSSLAILMDAPPDKEDSQPFVDLQQQLLAHNVPVPEILAVDLSIGAMLLEDLGDELLLAHLTRHTADDLYGKSLNALINMQAATPTDALDPYDAERLQTEMDLFTDWYLGTHLGINLTAAQSTKLGAMHQLLIDSALEQDVVFVHRDYHSRNLMLDEKQNIRIIDFQDALAGPITYDAVSLLRDCYVQWPQERIDEWLSNYHRQLTQQELTHADLNTFTRWFDWMGVQRHLKAVGIFARLNHRDGKSGYLNDIPRTLGYIQTISERYAELSPLNQLLHECGL